MGRSTRTDTEHGWHHVMNRGVDRRCIFFDDRDRVEFGRLLGVVHERFGVETAAYCLLDNHYHLVLHCPQGGLSEAMHVVGSVLARHTNDRIGRDGPLFRGRFHSVPILSDEQLLATVRYVHRNALDVSGVGRPADYRWSSHRSYLGHRRPPDFLVVDRVMEIFGGTAEAFDRFVDDDPVDATQVDVPADTRLRPLLAMAVDDVYGHDAPGPRFDRTVLLELRRRLGERRGRDLIDRLDFPNDEAMRRAMRRARQRAAADPRIAQVVDRTLDLLGGHTVPGTV